MRYRDYHVRVLVEEAISAYVQIPMGSRKLSIPEVRKRFMQYEEYHLFLEPVDKLVEMGELDFDSKTPLEEVVRILHHKP